MDIDYFYYDPSNHEESDQLEWPNQLEEMQKEEDYLKEEVIEVQVQKKSTRQKRNDTISLVFKLFFDNIFTWFWVADLIENQAK